MRRRRPVFGGVPVTVVVTLTLVAAMAGTARVRAGSGPDFLTFLPNNFPHTQAGHLDHGFHARLRRSHRRVFPGAGHQRPLLRDVSHAAGRVEHQSRHDRELFARTNGTHPIFNPLDADNPDADLSTVAARRAGYSMMLTRGVFRRGGAPRAEREWDVVDVDDPHGFATASRIVQWRRTMPTINFHVGSATVAWDGGNTVGTINSQGSPTRPRAT